MEIEIELKRLLQRMQASLANASHSSLSEEESNRRWTFIEYSKKLLNQLQINPDVNEDDIKRFELYEGKISFIEKLMLSSEGHRPSLLATVNPKELDDEYTNIKRQVVSVEENWTRNELFKAKEEVIEIISSSPKRLPNVTELRKRLGLTKETHRDSIGSSIHEQLEKDAKVRENIAENILESLSTIREQAINVQKNIQTDNDRINIVGNLLDQNISSVQKEIGRVNSLFQSTSRSCRSTCAMVSFVLMVWIGMYILMKITPKPK